MANDQRSIQSGMDEYDTGKLSIKDSIKLYKKAILWSLAISLAPIMEGYDVVLLGSFLGLSPFINKYGAPIGTDGTMAISAAWQSAIGCGTLVGCIIGLTINGLVAERFGYKTVLIASLILKCVFVFLTFFAQNIGTIVAGAVLIGIPWGVFQILPLTYIAEVIPLKLRGYMTTYINLCFVSGQLVGAGVVQAFSTRTDQWAYRVPLAIQWAWPIPIMIFTLFAPESPWWLVRNGRIEDAKRSLARLTSSSCGIPFDANREVSIIQATNEHEIQLTSNTGLMDCFRGSNLRRTEIVSIAWLIQTFCGFGLVAYSVVFLEHAGLSEKNSFSFNIGISGIGWMGTIASWIFLEWLGRRTLYLLGLSGMFTVLAVIGILGVLRQTAGVSWAIGSLLLVLALVYDVTIGPVCFTIVSEIPTTRLKIMSLAIARNVYNTGFIITNILVPRMLSAESWNWGAKSGFFWAGSCLLLFIWAFLRLPETVGRTFAEIDLLFEHQVGARDFSATDLSQFTIELSDIKKMPGVTQEQVENA